MSRLEGNALSRLLVPYETSFLVHGDLILVFNKTAHTENGYLYSLHVRESDSDLMPIDIAQDGYGTSCLQMSATAVHWWKKKRMNGGQCLGDELPRSVDTNSCK